MRLIIQHETRYRFGHPAQHSIQYLRLTPRPDLCQAVIGWQVGSPGQMHRWTDGFGNTAHVAVQNGTHAEVPVLVRGEIETFDTNGVLPSDDGLPPRMFLRSTPYTQVDDEIRALVQPLLERVRDEGLIAGLHALMFTLHTTVSYSPGFTDIESTAAEALAHGRGVCQDYAHLFIAGGRVLGIPTRYVSGYLYSEDGALASHAWAEAYVEDLGWVSFDCANSQCATEAYVRLAVAFDYAGASPIRGVRRGGGLEEMSVMVKVLRNDGQ